VCVGVWVCVCVCGGSGRQGVEGVMNISSISNRNMTTSRSLVLLEVDQTLLLLSQLKRHKLSLS